MWLTNIKIAIVEKNIDKLNLLLDEAPKFESRQDMEEGMYLLREASELIYRLKGETSASMKQMKKNIDFLNATEHKVSNRLDIKS